MFKLEIVQREEFGYSELVNSWKCPLCPFGKINDDLATRTVIGSARAHLERSHSIFAEYVEVSFISDKRYYVVAYTFVESSQKMMIHHPSVELLHLNEAIEKGGIWADGFPNDIVMLFEETV